MARSDYAANGGDTIVTGSTVWGSEAGPSDISTVESPTGQMTAAAQSGFAAASRTATGIMYCGSLLRMADITDGTSNTYLAGEKNITVDNYTTGKDVGDNEAALIGDNHDVTRWTAGNYPPFQDTNDDLTTSFGSAHSSGVNMAFCDGSVQQISYSINTTVHKNLGNRKDGAAIDASQF